MTGFACYLRHQHSYSMTYAKGNTTVIKNVFKTINFLHTWIFLICNNFRIKFTRNRNYKIVTSKERKGMCMRESRKKIIDPEFNYSVSMNLDNLAVVLKVPKKVIRIWREIGLVSYPVKKEEFDVLVKFINSTWCSRQMIRVQLSKLSVAERYYLILTTELTMFEKELYSFVLRWKLTRPNETLSKRRAWGVMKERFPNASKQFNGKMFMKAKKWASNLIARTKKNGKDIMLLGAFDLKYSGDESGIIERRKIPTKKEIQAKKAEVVASQQLSDSFDDELSDLCKIQEMKEILKKMSLKELSES